MLNEYFNDGVFNVSATTSERLRCNSGRIPRIFGSFLYFFFFFFFTHFLSAMV